MREDHQARNPRSRSKVFLGDERAFEDDYLDPRTLRLAGLSLTAPNLDDLRDKPRKRRWMKG